jgi:hypothetical protein
MWEVRCGGGNTHIGDSYGLGSSGAVRPSTMSNLRSSVYVLVIRDVEIGLQWLPQGTIHLKVSILLLDRIESIENAAREVKRDPPLQEMREYVRRSCNL